MIKSMNYKIDIMIDQIENISFKCSKERIANLIYRLASNYGKKDNKDVHLNLAFTHQELANLAGCSRVSVSRVLATLKSERIIRYSRNQFTVINMERLKKINNTFSEK
jgi:CRP-like cAMP-binding protein